MSPLSAGSPIYLLTAILIAPSLWVLKVFGIDFCQSCGKLKRLRWPVMSKSRYCGRDCPIEYEQLSRQQPERLPLLMKMAGRRRGEWWRVD